MTPERYMDLKREIIARGHADEIDWAETVKPVADSLTFWREYTWVILNSGMKNQVARKIADKVYPAVEGGGSAATVFGHKGKCAAIDRGWREREVWFQTYWRLTTDAAKMEFLRELPWIGGITCWHLAKNLGANVAKPDRHLVRIAGAEGTHALCERLSNVTGDRIATVDLVIWRAANLGLV